MNTKPIEAILPYLDKKWKWLAQDENGEIYTYEDKPRFEIKGWSDRIGTYRELDLLLINLECSWQDSLVDLDSLRLKLGLIEPKKLAKPEIESLEDFKTLGDEWEITWGVERHWFIVTDVVCIYRNHICDSEIRQANLPSNTFKLIDCVKAKQKKSFEIQLSNDLLYLVTHRPMTQAPWCSLDLVEGGEISISTAHILTIREVIE
jgi:hypothetical protein